MQGDSGTVWQTSSIDFSTAIEKLLDGAKLKDRLADQQKIILKPNLIEASKPPVTTPAALVTSIVDWLQLNCPHVTIVIAEGNGVTEYDTCHCFDVLGYTKLAKEKNIELIDLNFEPCRTLTNSYCRRWPQLALPDILFEGFLISVPVLKAHSMSQVTLAMKNMIGCAPPSDGGGWRKSQFHQGLDEAIVDLNRYRAPDFSIIDGSIGMAQAHLWGPTCNPAVGKILASYDPVAIDAYGAELLGKSWQNVGHIKLAHKVLGTAEPLRIEKI